MDSINNYYDEYHRNEKLREFAQERIEANEEFLKGISETQKAFRDMISKFEEMPDEVGHTTEAIARMNDELGKLDKITKTIVDSQQINIKARDTVAHPMKGRDTDGMSKEALDSYYFQAKEHYRNQASKNDKIEQDIKNAREEVTKGLYEMARSRVLLAEMERKTREAGYSEEVKSKLQPDVIPVEIVDDESKEEERKEENKEKAKQEDEKRRSRRTPPQWLGLAFRSLSGVVTTAFKVTLFPISLMFRGALGFLSGIWNSQIMGWAKVGAYIGLMVYMWDWLRVILATWKHDMREDLYQFFEDNPLWGQTIASIVKLTETIRSFFDKDYQSDFLDTNTSLFTQFLESLSGTLTGIMSNLFIEFADIFMVVLSKVVPGMREREYGEVKRHFAMKRGNVSDSELDISNIHHAKDHRYYESEDNIKSLFGDVNVLVDRMDRLELESVQEAQEKFEKEFSDFYDKLYKATADSLMAQDPTLTYQEANYLAHRTENYSKILNLLETIVRENPELRKKWNSFHASNASNLFLNDPVKFQKEYGSEEYNSILSGLIDGARFNPDMHSSALEAKLAERAISRRGDLTPLEEKSIARRYGYDDFDRFVKDMEIKSREFEERYAHELDSVSPLIKVMERFGELLDGLRSDLKQSNNQVNIQNNQNSYVSGITPSGDLPAFGSNGGIVRYT